MTPTTELCKIDGEIIKTDCIRRIRVSSEHRKPSHPIVYDQGQRIGEAIPVDFISNDRKPNNNF